MKDQGDKEINNISVNKQMKRGRRKKEQELSTFAKNLNRILKERGISTRVAAQMANVGQSTVQSWLTGAAPSNLEAVANLARGLGCSFSFLCLGQHEGMSLDEMPLSSLFKEEPAFEGVFKVSAVRLIRRTSKGDPG